MAACLIARAAVSGAPSLSVLREPFGICNQLNQPQQFIGPRPVRARWRLRPAMTGHVVSLWIRIVEIFVWPLIFSGMK